MDDFREWVENWHRMMKQRKREWGKHVKEQHKSHDIDWQRFREIWEDQMRIKRGK